MYELRQRLFRQPFVEQSPSTTVQTQQRRAESGVGCRPALPAGAMTVALACRLLHVASESRSGLPLYACEWPARAARTPMAMPGSCRPTLPPPDALRCVAPVAGCSATDQHGQSQLSGVVAAREDSQAGRQTGQARTRHQHRRRRRRPLLPSSSSLLFLMSPSHTVRMIHTLRKMRIDATVISAA